MRDLVYRYMGEQEAIKRQILTVDTVTQDVDGLKKLIVSAIKRQILTVDTVTQDVDGLKKLIVSYLCTEVQ